MSSWDKAEAWIAAATAHVRWKAARPALARELRGHLEDTAAALTAGGADTAFAQDAAVASMGDADEVGRQLNAAWRPKTSFLLPVCAAALCAFGTAAQTLCAGASLWRGFVLFFAAGVICCLFALLPLERMAQKGISAYLCYAAFLLAAVFFAPYRVNGRGVWLLSRVLFSCDYLFLFFPFFFALLIARLQKKGLFGILLAGLATVPTLAAALLMPSLSIFLLCAVSGLVLLTGAVLSGKMGCTKGAGLLLIWAPTCMVILFVIWRYGIYTPYFAHRLAAYLHPDADPYGVGWQTLTVRRVLAESGAFSAAGAESLSLLPTASSDLILTAFIGQMGWWVLWAVGLLLLALLLRGALAANRQQTLTGGLAAASAVLALGFESLLALLNALALMPPLSTLPLPFFSAFSTLTSAALIGILLAALRWSDLLQDPPFSPAAKFSELTNDGELIIRFR